MKVLMIPTFEIKVRRDIAKFTKKVEVFEMSVVTRDVSGLSGHSSCPEVT